MLTPWVMEEMMDGDLGDKRLNDRMAVLLDQLAGHPNASIPAACGGNAETTAAYRFFDNEKVDFERVLHPHIEATYRRMAEYPVVILAQDTTEIDVTRPEQQVGGAGPLDGDSRCGAFLHPLIGFTPDGTPLGTVYAEAWTRPDESPRPKTRRKRELARRRTPIEEKESIRWVDSYRQAQKLAEAIPETEFICVSDSESDIYELLEESQAAPRPDWIVRACQNRAIEKHEKQEETTENHLRERALSENVLFTNTITVRGRKTKVNCDKRRRNQPRASRTAEVEVRVAKVILRAPSRPDRKLRNVSVNVVLVTEVNPPEADMPVEWILLTSLPIDEVEQVQAVIQYYCVRWMIEIFFRTLKSGCRVERRRLEHIDRLLPCLGIYLIVTWRTLMVCRLGREYPEISCEAVFEPAEWKSVYCVIHKTSSPPTTPPTLQKMVRMVAQLGGYVNRKRSDEPGPQTVWLGLQRLHDIAQGWVIFGPEAKNRKTIV